jgi:hypothetical protein
LRPVSNARGLLQYSFRMLSFITSLFSIDPKYKKYLKIAGVLLVFGYLSLLALIYVAFNKYDIQNDGARPDTTARAGVTGMHGRT